MSERDIRKLLALVEKHLGRSWLEISDWLRSQNSLDAIENRLLAGDYHGVVAEVESAARTFASSTHQAFNRAGETAAKWLDEQPALKDKLVRFDVKNDRAIYAAERNELELVSGLTQETREVVSNIIIDGTRRSANPREMARDIRDSITLTPTQAQHVANYRRALESGDFANALSRELRDGRSDKLLRRLSRDDERLTDQQIDKLVDKYRKNYVAYRAEVIARTEAAANVHAGMAEAYQQAIDRGDIEADQLTKEWLHAGGGKNSRPDHKAMDGVSVKFDEVFVLPDGTRMRYPHDPNAGADQNAQCRCTYATRLEAA